MLVCPQVPHSSALSVSVPVYVVRCVVNSRQVEEQQKGVHCAGHLFPWKQGQKVRSNLQKLIFMVCVLSSLILLIPSDSTLAIRHNVFFIGVLFNNMLIDGYHGVVIGGQSVFQTLEILKQWPITNGSMVEIRTFMTYAHLPFLYCFCLVWYRRVYEELLSEWWWVGKVNGTRLYKACRHSESHFMTGGAMEAHWVCLYLAL